MRGATGTVRSSEAGLLIQIKALAKGCLPIMPNSPRRSSRCPAQTPPADKTHVLVR